MENILEFAEWLDGTVEAKYRGWGALERSKRICEGNVRLESKHLASACRMAIGTITRAQYGRAKVELVAQALEAASVSPETVFVDIGSGVGSVVFQAALACKKATGIELCRGRHETAQELYEEFKIAFPEAAGRTHLFPGDFRNPENFDVPRDADVLFVNNAKSIFSVRSVAEGSNTLDWHVSRLACGMRVGSRIIAFESLTDLEHPNVGQCFERAEYLSTPGATSWTDTSMSRTPFYMYTKRGNTWTCSSCKAENPLLEEKNGRIQDRCAACPAKTYPKRARHNS
jgi:hypothetical protein